METETMRLIHFSEDPVIFDPAWDYTPPADRYDNGKPLGLWVSDEDDYGWSRWCRSEEWNVGGLRYKHLVTLKPNANILVIRSPMALMGFTDKYKADNELNRITYRSKALTSTDMVMSIDWQQVAKDYQGIIITPYIWKLRLNPYTMWYYSWDCASGCIFDLSAIDSFELVRSRVRMQEKKLLGDK